MTERLLFWGLFSLVCRVEDIVPQNLVHAGLVAFALGLEGFKNVDIDLEVDVCLFGSEPLRMAENSRPTSA